MNRVSSLKARYVPCLMNQRLTNNTVGIVSATLTTLNKSFFSQFHWKISTTRFTVSLHQRCFVVSSADASESKDASLQPQSASVRKIESNLKGTVKWFSTRKSYGFIKVHGRDDDVYVHACDIAKKNPLHSERSLQTGEEVEFCIEADASGQKRKATKVTGPDVAPVKGVYSPANWTPNLLFGNHRRVEGKIVERDVEGTVKTFHLVNGWGFITRADNGTDIFVRSSGIMGKNPLHPVRSLREGEPVLEDRDGRRKAVAVTGPNGVPVQGKEEADGPLAIRILRGEFRGPRNRPSGFGNSPEKLI